MGLKSILTKKHKEIGRERITRSGEAREVVSIRVYPSVWRRFTEEIERRRDLGQKITRGEVIEELIEKWLEGAENGRG